MHHSENLNQSLMASASEDESEGNLFVGFGEDREAVAAFRQARFEARQESDSESDISDISDVSSMATADLSIFTDSEEEEETWNVDENPVRVLPFTEPSGQTSGVAEDRTAIAFFYSMFPEDLIEHMVTETNRYVRESIAAKPDPEWFDTMHKAFLGFHVLFGINQLPAIRLYWSNDPLIRVLAVQKVMSRNRFDKLSKYFHLNNNANQLPREDVNYDKLFKVQPLLDRVIECCQTELRPD